MQTTCGLCHTIDFGLLFLRSIILHIYQKSTSASFFVPVRTLITPKLLRNGHVPPKLVLIGSYTLKGKDGSSIDFMCLTMIDPTISWFKIVELPTVRVTIPKGGNGKKATRLDYTKDAQIFDKTSAQISNLVYK
jgi:hypothetical protein